MVRATAVDDRVLQEPLTGGIVAGVNRVFRMVAALLAVAACACTSARLRPIRPHTGGIPRRWIAHYKVGVCTTRDGATMPPPPVDYYLVRLSSGPALLQLDALGEGTVLDSYVADQDGVSFAGYERRGGDHAAHQFIAPSGHAVEAMVAAYDGGDYSVVKRGTGVRIAGTPSVLCTLVAQAGPEMTPGACASNSASAPGPACVPGRALACVGPGGCPGGQVCLDTGAAFGACDCGLDAGAPNPPIDTPRDAGTDGA